MKKRLAIVGAGAIGGYVGGLLVRAGIDVTLIESWPEHVEAIRQNGVKLFGVTPEVEHTIQVRTLHISDVQQLSKERPVDIAMIAVKSYDTEWATTMIAPYLAPDGYVVSMQNCINEERIAGIVGWGRTVGCVVSRLSSDMYEAGHVKRTVPLYGPNGKTFYVGEVHGRTTRRIEELAEIIAIVDGCVVTPNLWGERWSKLCVNVMRNGVSAVTGLGGNARDLNVAARRFCIRLGGEAVRVGKALGYAFDHVATYDAEELARAAEGDAEALGRIEAIIIREAESGKRSDAQRPSMAQDIMKGRRTEIDYINGYVAAQAGSIGLEVPANVAITEAVKRIERGEIAAKPDSLPLL